MLPAEWSLWKRVGALTSPILPGGIIFLSIKYPEEVQAWTESALARMIPEWAVEWKRSISETLLIFVVGIAAYANTGNTASDLFALVILAVCLGLAHAGKTVASTYAILFSGAAASGVAVAGAGIDAAIVTLMYVLTLTYSFVIALAGGVNVAGTIAVVGAGGLTVLFSIVGYFAEKGVAASGPLDISYFIFLSALPFLNAVLDASSWAASRWLGREILDRNFHRWGMIGFSLLDFVLAFLFLSMLAVLLGAVGESIDQLAFATTGSHVLNLDAIIRQATMDPFGDGLWITLMLFSTLVPTAIHAFVAIGSVIQLRGQTERRAEWREKADEALADDEGLDPHTCRKITEHWLVDRWLPSVILLLVLLATGWFAWQVSVLPDTLLAAVKWGRSLVA